MQVRKGATSRERRPPAWKDLSLRERSCPVSLGRRIAPLKFHRRKFATVDEEALDASRPLSERLAEHNGPAFVGRTLARCSAAIPRDVASDEASAGWRRKRGRIVRRRTGRRQRCKGEQKIGRTDHRITSSKKLRFATHKRSSCNQQLFFGTVVCFDDIQRESERPYVRC